MTTKDVDSNSRVMEAYLRGMEQTGVEKICETIGFPALAETMKATGTPLRGMAALASDCDVGAFVTSLESQIMSEVDPEEVKHVNFAITCLHAYLKRKYNEAVVKENELMIASRKSEEIVPEIEKLIIQAEVAEAPAMLARGKDKSSIPQLEVQARVLKVLLVKAGPSGIYNEDRVDN